MLCMNQKLLTVSLTNNFGVKPSTVFTKNGLGGSLDNQGKFWHNKIKSSARRWMRHWWAPRTSNPSYSSNFSDLAPKTMQTNADKALECRQNADK